MPGCAMHDPSAATHGVTDIAMLQTLTRNGDIAALTAGHWLAVVDECRHVPAGAFEHAIRQVIMRGGIGAKARAAALARLRLDNANTRARSPRRSTTTTTRRPAYSPPHSPATSPAI